MGAINNKVSDILFPAKCPKCGGMFGTSERGKIKCKFCGSEFFLTASFAEKEEAIRNFYELATTAITGENYQEATSFYTKILEISPTESGAWFGKGISAAYLCMSIYGYIKATEVIACFEKAIETTPSEDRIAVAQETGRAVGHIALNFYKRSIYTGSPGTTVINDWLDLFYYWETKEPDNLECWKAIVDITSMQNYNLYDNKKYSDKIRSKYDPNFLSYIEKRDIEHQNSIRDSRRRSNIKGLLVLALLLLLFLTLIIVCRNMFSKNTTSDIISENNIKYIQVEVDWGLPVRATPDPNGKLIKILKKGEQLPIIGTEGDWRQVQINGKTGWVRVTLNGETLASEILLPPISK